MAEEIINRVAESNLVTIDLEKLYPTEEKLAFDLKDYLFMGLVLKEKDFREALKKVRWENYNGKNVAVFCSADAIVPVWAYMLVGVYLAPVAKRYYFCHENELDDHIFQETISSLDVTEYQDKRLIIKGCGDKSISPSAYLAITRKLLPVARSLMYGEACSNVPLYKQKSALTHS